MTTASRRRLRWPSTGVVRDSRILKHIVVMGQSNGVAGNANPALSTVPSASAKMFVGGTRPGSSGANLASLLPLVEASGETVASGLTSWLNAQTGDAYLVSNVALNGAPYTSIAKGQQPYTDAIAQVTQAKALAAQLYSGYQVLCMLLIHGENDQTANNTSYAANVATLQSVFETDAKALSGQSAAIPCFACQQNGYLPSAAGTQPGNGTYGSASAYTLFQAYLANPTKTYIVASRYTSPYITADALHLGNHAQRWLGERYARAINAAIYGSGWSPLYPTSVAIVGAVITVQFNVPTAPLVFDYARILNPDVGHGFAYWDDSGAIPAITGVALNGTTAVDITLASTPAAFTYRQVRYGHTGTASRSGTYQGGRGCLRDSDVTVSQYGYPLNNHCIQFVVTF
jgi:hypothetical protein